MSPLGGLRDRVIRAKKVIYEATGFKMGLSLTNLNQGLSQALPGDADTGMTTDLDFVVKRELINKGQPNHGGVYYQLEGRWDYGTTGPQDLGFVSLASAGELHEKVYDIAWSEADTRKPNANGKLPPVGNTVDLQTATWSNSIGSTQLSTVWTDPDFDPAEQAFYYVRVLEIPTPRWTLYDSVRFGIKVDKEVPMTHQERAYSSPIWYTP